jgi:hypothetical protein
LGGGEDGEPGPVCDEPPAADGVLLSLLPHADNAIQAAATAANAMGFIYILLLERKSSKSPYISKTVKTFRIDPSKTGKFVKSRV